MIERYDMYRCVPPSADEAGAGGGDVDVDDEYGDADAKMEVAVADMRVGRRLDGHGGVVHGGIACLLFDDAMGWGFEALVLSERERRGEDGGDIPVVVTANLNVDFRHPLPADSDAVLRVYHDRTDRRKLFMSARLESRDGKVLNSKATSLFIVLKQ